MEKGIAMVATEHNAGQESYPAYFSKMDDMSQKEACILKAVLKAL